MQPQTATRTEPVQEAHHDEVVVKCPAKGEVVGTVPVTPRAEIESAAARLRATQPQWEAIGTRGSRRMAGQMARLDAQHADEPLTLVRRETGKSSAIRIWSRRRGTSSTAGRRTLPISGGEAIHPVGMANAA